MKQPDLVGIVFTKSQPPYHPGEGARRSPKGASLLVALGVAKYVDPPPGLDEYGIPLKERAAPKKVAKPKPKAKAKAKPRSRLKPA